MKIYNDDDILLIIIIIIYIDLFIFINYGWVYRICVYEIFELNR